MKMEVNCLWGQRGLTGGRWVRKGECIDRQIQPGIPYTPKKIPSQNLLLQANKNTRHSEKKKPETRIRVISNCLESERRDE